MAQLTQTIPAVPRACAVIPEVAEIAQQRLRDCPYIALRRVSCRFREGVLMLTGEVPTYHMKQMAQTLVRGVEAVEVIDNRLVVNK